ncbi:MAG: vWA domain-containing protein [Deltaproteobacteria bacterium]
MINTRQFVLLSGIAGSSACTVTTADPAPDFQAGSSATNEAGGSAARGSSAAARAVSATEGPLGLVDESPEVLRPDQVCGGVVIESEPLPLDMYFLVDSSGSMAEPTASGVKWNLVSGALAAFAADPANATINMGIGYFPSGVTATCTAAQAGCLCIPVINLCIANLGGSCTASDYAAPAVPLALESASQRLVADLGTHQLAGGTPTRPALEGTYQYLEGWAREHPGRKVVAVLATDGEPAGCLPNGVADVARAAAAAAAGPSHIQTFVIGVGPALDKLNQIAAAGGTTRAFLMDGQSDLSGAFAAALDAIRTAAAPCAFEIGATGDQGPIDPARVNIRIQPEGAPSAQLVGKTSDGTASTCVGTGGWHYDNPAAPQTIQLCDGTCSAIRNARVEVEFGCETVVQRPR